MTTDCDPETVTDDNNMANNNTTDCADDNEAADECLHDDS